VGMGLLCARRGGDDSAVPRGGARAERDREADNGKGEPDSSRGMLHFSPSLYASSSCFLPYSYYYVLGTLAD
jgi:hypothetical protein